MLPGGPTIPRTGLAPAGLRDSRQSPTIWTDFRSRRTSPEKARRGASPASPGVGSFMALLLQGQPGKRVRGFEPRREFIHGSPKKGQRFREEERLPPASERAHSWFSSFKVAQMRKKGSEVSRRGASPASIGENSFMVLLLQLH